MKKLILTSVCTLAVAGCAFAQGSVNWTTTPSAITAQTNSTTYSPLFGGGATGSGAFGATAAIGGQFYYELLYSGVNVPVTGPGVAKPTTVVDLASWSDAGLKATNSLSAGRLTAVSGGTQVSVPWAAGTTQNVMLVGWSVNLGTTWAAALNNLQNWDAVMGSISGPAYFGMSTTGYIAPNSANPATSVFATAATPQGLPIFSLNTQLYLLPVPEPSTIALAGLGGLAMLALRRQK